MTGEFAIAVHALVFLNHKQELISSEILADNVCTNPARVRKIMSKLKKAGLITTKEGLEGGYAFESDPATVTLKQVSEAVEAEFVSASWKSGSREKNCMISSGMAAVMDKIYLELDELCKEHLKEKTIEDIDKVIFQKKSQ